MNQENIDRARRVEEYLKSYADHYDAGEEGYTVFVDFLADMMHYALLHDQNWDTLESSAMLHFMAETAGEE